MTWPSRWENGDLEFKHESVLVNETLDSLKINPDGIYVDGTLGGGGHSFKIIQKLRKGRLIDIDQDQDALDASYKRLAIFKEKVTLVKDNYANIKQILQDLKIDQVDGILLDIGVSSFQIDNPERGFTYREDAPLDMRMDKQSALTAREVVNTYSREDLARIIRDYGEEKFANNIAKHIEEARKESPIETTGQLKEIIEHAIPAAVRKGQQGFAKKTFQALRIEVNSELDVLDSSIDTMIGLLKPGGRLAIITFHSLEDRIVKNRFRENENPCTCPPDFPVCVCGAVSRGKVITRKPIVPTPEECARNKRAGSAKLRVFERS
ncbi:MAG: 16S rRNA (cytosine(1402)-N(4))-methyltransferase RsmH [Parasporobacterium sp.]|nr:16S rRNA (cytosine(1402)-N(4))-methyltransferase RsmH [Parasporobacterium sp.]